MRLLFGLAMVCFMLMGCASTEPYRQRMGSTCDLQDTQAKNAPPDSECAQASIEKKNDLYIAYIELTDQGWLHNRKQLTDALNLLKVAAQEEEQIDIVVFVHGWKHSASFNDENVIKFRDVILPKLVSKKPKTRTVGIFVGWRGASLNLSSFLQNVTFYDRKFAADHVARGSVRELFAHLHTLRNEPSIKTKKIDKLTIIGHSFGGLIVFNSISESLINALVVANHGDVKLPREITPIADLVLLLNPAFEASRFEPLFQVAKDHLEKSDTAWKYAETQRPVLVTITSEADWATKIAFPIGRTINSIFDHEGWTDQDPQPRGDYSQRLEKKANIRTPGHMERYRTHYLQLSPQSKPGNEMVECNVQKNPLFADEHVFPLWNIFAAKQVIPGHNEIYADSLWDFISSLADTSNPGHKINPPCR
jgi:pimeloyl-ACP methyl ester carboxylesterase